MFESVYCLALLRCFPTVSVLSQCESWTDCHHCAESQTAKQSQHTPLTIPNVLIKQNNLVFDPIDPRLICELRRLLWRTESHYCFGCWVEVPESQSTSPIHPLMSFLFLNCLQFNNILNKTHIQSLRKVLTRYFYLMESLMGPFCLCVSHFFFTS